MTRRSALGTLLSLAAAAALSACSPDGGLKLPGGAPGFDKTRLEAGVDRSFGGVGTCVESADMRKGEGV